MEQLLTVYEQQEKNDINVIRTVALSGLMIYLKDSSDLFRICKDEMDFQEGTVALVAMADVPGGVPFSTQQVFIVLEDQVVMSAHHGLMLSCVCLG
uniref:Uncharacterized protein n=1 Tax=Knipowitschia caucasica TaxID=637954 RepID=A0AAV2LJH1_KNICA